jgi:endoglucanase Acf2
MAAGSIAAMLFFSASASAQIVPVGSGSYTRTLPAGGVNPVAPKVTANVTGPAPSTDWWSSLIFPRTSGNYGDVLAAQPLNLKAAASGLGVGTGAIVPTGPNYYAYGYQEDLLVKLAGLSAPSTKVAGYSDWTVTARWDDGTRRLDATFGHGLPFIYFTKSGGTLQLYFATGLPTVWYNQNGTLGIKVNNKNYGVFAPSGSTWNTTGTTFQSDLNGSNYVSVACLPNATTATIELFRAHAFAFPTDTRVAWHYDETSATVTTDYVVRTEMKEGTPTSPLLALYRHQYLHSDASLLGLSYSTLEGEMKLAATDSFRTTMTYPGILPQLAAPLADSPGYDPVQLNAYLDGFLAQSYAQLFYRPDTYYGGKDLGVVSSAIRVADQAGRTDVRDYLLTGLKQKLEDWLTAEPGETDGVFYYNPTWGTMCGYPASFGTDSELNDHHFHWGYFVMAASVVAMYDADWASQAKWGGMIDLLIRDADSPDRSDALFPFLRCFDPYAGHSWASGHANFGDGNNQESSSEAMQFAAGTALWGSITGDATIRDLGVYLYTTEMAAIEQYWFDVDNVVFPASYPHTCLGMVWGTKAVHETWFSAQPEMIHGINMLPITPASLYLGRHPDYVLANYAEVVSENGGPPNDWRDILWEYRALADPHTAVGYFAADPNYTPEDGESKAHTYYWLHALSALGRLDPTVTADVPHFAVFDGDVATNYVYYNPDSTTRTIHFSDGRVVSAAPRAAGVLRWVPGVSSVGPPPASASVVLYAARPNPFNRSTRIAFTMPHAAMATLRIYDASGRLVAVPLANRMVGPGRTEVVWTGADEQGRAVPAGIYFSRLETAGAVRTKRVALVE